MFVDSQLTLFVEDTPANLSALLGSARENLTSATSGRKCCELSENADPLGLFAKMLKDTLPLALTPFSTIWSEKATPQGRSLSRLLQSARNMPGRGSLWFPTIKASDSIMGMTARTSGRPIEMSTHLQTIVGLSVGWKPGDGRLNPEWAEWFMGFPLRWTDCECLETL